MNIVVTGASKGIGYELVKELSLDSSNTIIAVARSKKLLEKLKQECIKKNKTAKVIVVEADLSDLNSISLLVKNISKQIKYIDILINNAGHLLNKAFEKMSIADIQSIYTVNVFAAYKLIQEFLPYFNKKNRSHIVNISSMGAVQGSVKFPGLSAYSSSKAALIGITECLALELSDKNIAVNCLALGSVQTEMLSKAFPSFKAKTSASEMAKYIADFSLTGQAYFNGKILPVSLSTP